MDQRKQYSMCLVAGLLLLAFAIRWAPAFVPHFWGDEVFTIDMVQSGPRKILALTSRDAHPPLYYYWVKCFATVGRRVGGFFATLAWLRMASILPGTLTCLLGWWAARRWWGPRRALWVLALFAVSPALTFYSVELRSYSSIHLLLLGVLIGLLELTHPQARHHRAGAVMAALCAILVFYTHSLSCIYLVFFALIFLAEVAFQPARRKELMLTGIAIALPVAICCAPWTIFMGYQANRINEHPWVAWVKFHDLPLTFLWHLPFGYWPSAPQPDRRLWFAVAVNGAGLLGLAINAMRTPMMDQKGFGIDGNEKDGQPGTRSDRLMIYAALMATLPVLTAIFLSWMHIAKIASRLRYNLVATPFFLLLLAGLFFRVSGRRRCGMFLGLLVLFAAFSTVGLRSRFTNFSDIQGIAKTYDPGMLNPNSRFYWTSSAVPFWLNRCGPFKIGQFKEALAGNDANPSGDSYFLTHIMYTCHRPEAGQSTGLLEGLLALNGAAQMDVAGYWEYMRVWRANPQQVAAVRAQWPVAQAVLAARRASIPGGQVILPDQACAGGLGWSNVWYEKNWMPQCWTEGNWQYLAWPGPERPGRYRIEMTFYRANPFPEKEVTLKYRLPFELAWSEQRAALGWVKINGEVTTHVPREPMRVELLTPTWVPEKCIPGSPDGRELGMTFTGLELRPTPGQKVP